MIYRVYGMEKFQFWKWAKYQICAKINKINRHVFTEALVSSSVVQSKGAFVVSKMKCKGGGEKEMWATIRSSSSQASSCDDTQSVAALGQN